MGSSHKLGWRQMENGRYLAAKVSAAEMDRRFALYIRKATIPSSRHVAVSRCRREPRDNASGPDAWAARSSVGNAPDPIFQSLAEIGLELQRWCFVVRGMCRGSRTSTFGPGRSRAPARNPWKGRDQGQ